MRLESKKYLFDIKTAAERIQRFVSGKDFVDYQRDDLLRSAVERQFEVIGEALGRLYRMDQQTATRVSDFRRIIAFRNILIHGYAEVDDRLVWGIIERNVAQLLSEVEHLLRPDQAP